MAKRKKTEVITHTDPDLEATFSVAVVKLLIAAYTTARVIFMPSNWDGKGRKRKRIIVDIDAGEEGFKGKITKEGKTLSAFSLVVDLFCRDHVGLLQHFMKYLDAEDSEPSAVHFFLKPLGVNDQIRNLFERTGLKMVFQSFKRHHNGDDVGLIKSMSIILEGYIALRKMTDAEIAGKNFLTLAEFMPAWVVKMYHPDFSGAPVTLDHQGNTPHIPLIAFKGGCIGKETAFEVVIDKHVDGDYEWDAKILRGLYPVIEASKQGKTLVESLLKDLDQDNADMLNAVSLETIFQTFQLHCQGDLNKLMRMMSVVLDGYFDEAKIGKEAYELVKAACGKNPSDEVKAQISVYGRDVAVIHNVDNHRLGSTLFNDRFNFKYAIRLDDAGIIIQRNNNPKFGLTVNHPILHQVIIDAGEELGQGYGLWYTKDDHTLARGTKTAPVFHPSLVSIDDLVKACLKIWAPIQRRLDQEHAEARRKAEVAQQAIDAQAQADADEYQAKKAREDQADADAAAQRLQQETADAEARERATEASKKAAKEANKRAKGSKRKEKKSKKKS